MRPSDARFSRTRRIAQPRWPEDEPGEGAGGQVLIGEVFVLHIGSNDRAGAGGDFLVFFVLW